MPHSLNIFDMQLILTSTVSKNPQVHFYLRIHLQLVWIRVSCFWLLSWSAQAKLDCTLLSLFHLIFTVASLSHIIILFKFILSSFQRLGAEMHRKASSSMMLRLILRGLQLSKMWQIIVKISSSALTVIYLCLHFSFACFFNDNHSLSHHFKFH